MAYLRHRRPKYTLCVPLSMFSCPHERTDLSLMTYAIACLFFEQIRNLLPKMNQIPINIQQAVKDGIVGVVGVDGLVTAGLRALAG
jgi:hypothetical protein